MSMLPDFEKIFKKQPQSNAIPPPPLPQGQDLPQSITLQQILSNLLGLTNYQPQPQVPPEIQQQLEQEQFWSGLQQKNQAWSDEARRIMRGQPGGMAMPMISGAPDPNTTAPLQTEEGGYAFLPVGQFPNRDDAYLPQEGVPAAPTMPMPPEMQGKRRMPGAMPNANIMELMRLLGAQ